MCRSRVDALRKCEMNVRTHLTCTMRARLHFYRTRERIVRRIYDSINLNQVTHPVKTIRSLTSLDRRLRGWMERAQRKGRGRTVSTENRTILIFHRLPAGAVYSSYRERNRCRVHVACGLRKKRKRKEKESARSLLEHADEQSGNVRIMQYHIFESNKCLMCQADCVDCTQWMKYHALCHIVKIYMTEITTERSSLANTKKKKKMTEKLSIDVKTYQEIPRYW